MKRSFLGLLAFSMGSLAYGQGTNGNCFDQQADWLACAGTVPAAEDFSGFVADVPFDSVTGVPTPIWAGTGLIESVGDDPTPFRNLIDTPPFLFGDNNGTNHASCFTNADNAAGGTTDVLITFPAGTTAFGCAATGATSGEMAEMAYLDAAGAVVDVCCIATNNTDQFAGYVSDSGTLAQVRFQSVNLNPGGAGEGFTIDNLQTGNGTNCAPPVPACGGPQTQPPCLGSHKLTTFFAGNNLGNVGGAIYFDIVVNVEVNVLGLEHNYINVTAGIGGPVGMDVYTIPGSHVGNEGNIALWTLAGQDDGTAFAAPPENPTTITLQNPINLPAGSYGIALVAFGGANRYTNGTGGNQVHMTPEITLTAGSATNVPFTGNVFTPRVWNGSLCYDTGTGGIGAPDPQCLVIPNSTGLPGALGATGSPVAATNNVTLNASDLPLNQFGYFLATRTPGGYFNPMGSNGIVCVTGDIGRYNQPAAVFFTGGTGTGSHMIDLTAMPWNNPPPTIVGGDTAAFQCWYRDVGNTNNFTNSIIVNFL